jgi:hypothetical protein
MSAMDYQQKQLIDKLRNAVAADKLVIVTGAGVSVKVPRKKGGTIPSWGNLIGSIKSAYVAKLNKLNKNEKTLLSKLTPDACLGEVHGDALIEASEIIERAVGKEDFAKFVAEETTEEVNKRGDYHDIIATLDPRAIITFNYDKCHENGYQGAGKPFNKVVYSDERSLREMLKAGFEKPTMILKAHGCVSEPSSLVLTSSSYLRIINEFRAYRAAIQHILSRFTILVVGFALRDRDFDQILLTIERDYGSSVQDHIVIMKTEPESTDPDKEKERKIQVADFAALEARYGLKVFPVDDFKKIPLLLKSLSKTPGSFVKRLATDVASPDLVQRKSARADLPNLSDVGKNQISDLLVRKIQKSSESLEVRSEQIYALGLLRPRDEQAIHLLVEECVTQSKVAQRKTNKIDHIECVAHALVSLRGTTLQSHSQLEQTKKKLLSNSMLKRMELLDQYLENLGQQARLVDYLRASFSELSERSLHYLNNA